MVLYLIINMSVIILLCVLLYTAHTYIIDIVDEQTYGLRSKYSSTKLSVTIYNHRSDYVYLWWMNYSGSYVYYGAIRPYTSYLQRSYGTHPWVITDKKGYIIATVVPYTRNVKLSI